MEEFSKYLPEELVTLVNSGLEEVRKTDNINYKKLLELSLVGPELQDLSDQKKNYPDLFEAECIHLSGLIEECFNDKTLIFVGLYLGLNYDALLCKKILTTINPPGKKTISPFVYVMQ
ncbi:MAG: hypothetical protein PF503_22780 [Desulfobacula sp.]|jgi:hypothetical protein|nr:hypothetical protein [Desulfobacula sp.]